MSKLFAQVFLSILISLGLIAGIPSVRKEVKHVLHETKTTAFQMIDSTKDIAENLTSRVNAKLNADTGVKANAGTDSNLQVGLDAKAKTTDSIKIDSGDQFLGLDGTVKTNLTIGLQSGK